MYHYDIYLMINIKEAVTHIQLLLVSFGNLLGDGQQCELSALRSF